MRTLVEQLHDAFERSGLSVAELLAKSGLPIERSSLSRKLRGELRMNADECQALADALGVPLVWMPDPPTETPA